MNQQFRIGLRRIDHHGRHAIGADALHQFEGILRVTVQVDDDDVVILQQLWHFGKIGRIDRKLMDFHIRASGKSAGRRLAALLVRADQRNRQNVGAKRVGILGFEMFGRF